MERERAPGAQVLDRLLAVGLAAFLLVLAASAAAFVGIRYPRAGGAAVAPSPSDVAAAIPSASPPPSASAATPPATASPAPPTPGPTATRPAPTPRPSPVPRTAGGPQPPSPATRPLQAVIGFYAAVTRHDWPLATSYWSPSMQSRYPPREYIVGRFARTTGIWVQWGEVVARDDAAGTARVSLTVLELRSVAPYRRTFVGSWDLVRIAGRWYLDRPHF